MFTYAPKRTIKRVLCPTDLSDKSQETLAFSAQLADRLSAELSACHCAPALWFARENKLAAEKVETLKKVMAAPIVKYSMDRKSKLHWKSTVIDNSFDPARDILDLAASTSVDLIVMKARTGIISALHFGSIVERVVSGSKCPVMLLPAGFLDRSAKDKCDFTFRRILFDYDFAEATDDLFRVAEQVNDKFNAEMHVVSVLEPVGSRQPALAGVTDGGRLTAAFTRDKLSRIVDGTPRKSVTSVEWGRHAETVLRYAVEQDVDMICTTLSPPYFYLEKLYRSYLGRLLKTANCPILVKQSV